MDVSGQRHAPAALPQGSGVPRNFFSGEGGGGFTKNFFREGGVQQIQLRTEGRENGDLGTVAP
jgi:hypothetical protein